MQLGRLGKDSQGALGGFVCHLTAAQRLLEWAVPRVQSVWPSGVLTCTAPAADGSVGVLKEGRRRKTSSGT